MKIAGMGIIRYLSDKFNVLDMLLVVAAIAQFSYGNPSDHEYLAAFGTFRFIRTFRYLSTWGPLEHILKAILKSLDDLLPFCLLLLIYCYVCAVIGMNLFRGGYLVGFIKYRPNFDNFLWSALSVFQVQILL
jgi:voltage-dependent calcium channel L type alpha-1D